MTDGQIKELAGSLEIGLRCFVNKLDRTILTIPDADDDELDSDWSDVKKQIKKNSKNLVELERMNSNESFKLMSNFVDTIERQDVRIRFEKILERPKPFMNFKFEIDNSGPYREKWFKFKDEQMINRVKEQVLKEGL